MKQAHLLSMVLLMASSSTLAQDCSVIDSDTDRLRCYDTRFPRPTPAATAPATPAVAAATPASPGSPPPPAETAGQLPLFFKNVKLANETAPSGALRSEPANFSYAKLNGNEYSVVQAALIWEPSVSWFPDGSYLSDYGWGPYLSYTVNRNSLPTKRSDSRQGSIGLYGTVFSIKGDKQEGQLLAPIDFGMAARLDISQRRNRVDGTESSVYTADGYFVSRRLFHGIPNTDKLAWFVSPRIGLQWDDRKQVKAGSVAGKTRSAFWQLKGDLYLGAPFERAKLTVLAQRYVDLSASPGLTERYENFSKIGIEYLLYPPRVSNAPLQPSLALERSYGADLINGLPRQGLTQLVFKLKVN